MQKEYKQPACCIFLQAICYALSCEDGERMAESVNCTAAVEFVKRSKTIFFQDKMTNQL